MIFHAWEWTLVAILDEKKVKIPIKTRPPRLVKTPREVVDKHDFRSGKQVDWSASPPGNWRHLCKGCTLCWNFCLNCGAWLWASTRGYGASWPLPVAYYTPRASWEISGNAWELMKLDAINRRGERDRVVVTTKHRKMSETNLYNYNNVSCEFELFRVNTHLCKLAVDTLAVGFQWAAMIHYC